VRSRELLEIREKVVKALEKLCKDLDAEVYLFGSFAKNTYTKHSDVDVVIVSERFKGVRYVDRIAIARTRLPMKYSFDIIALTHEELGKKLSNSFYKEISSHWIMITCGR
jgi:predicted nucleotidyltransferase